LRKDILKLKDFALNCLTSELFLRRRFKYR